MHDAEQCADVNTFRRELEWRGEYSVTARFNEVDFLKLFILTARSL